MAGLAELHALEQGLDHILATARHGDGNAQVALDLLVFSQQHVEHHAVDLIIDAEVGEHANLGLGLAETIDPAFALSCRVGFQDKS